MKAMALRAQQKGLELAYDISPEVPPDLVGDPGRLRQILVNLVGNAVKFTEQGEVVVSATSTPQGDGASLVRFSVRDSGPGINQETADHLFSPFRRGPAGHRYVLSGTGLGLGLCRKLVSIMGGELELESRPHWGTRFFFELELPTVGPLAI